MVRAMFARILARYNLQRHNAKGYPGHTANNRYIRRCILLVMERTCKVCGRKYDTKAGCRYCLTKRYRQKNKVRYAYTALRDNAKRRGKAFELTFDEFEAFCVKTKLLYKRGREKDSYTVDRIDPTKGYTIDNIQMLTYSENSRKARIDKMLLNVTNDGEQKEFRFVKNRRP